MKQIIGEVKLYVLEYYNQIYYQKKISDVNNKIR